MQQKGKTEQIIETAKKLFLMHGLRRVTVDEICKTAQVSRVTFYKYYKNKEELAIRVLDRLMEENLRLFRSIMKENIPYSEKLKKIFDIKIQKNREYGPHFLQDILSGSESIQNYIQKKRMENMALTRQLLEEGQKAGEIAPELTLELFLYYGELLTEAIDDERFRALVPDIGERATEVTRFFMYGIMNKENKK